MKSDRIDMLCFASRPGFELPRIMKGNWQIAEDHGRYAGGGTYRHMAWIRGGRARAAGRLLPSRPR